MLVQWIALWLLCVCRVFAAYVQTKQCSDKDHDVLNAWGELSFRASIAPSNDNHERSRLTLTFSGSRSNATMCSDFELLNFTSTIQMVSLAGSPSYDGIYRPSKCVEMDSPRLRYPSFDFVYDIAKPYALETYFTRVDVRDKGRSIDCLNAYVTPDIGEAASQTVTWVPIGVFLLVILASLWREAYNLSDEGAVETQQIGPSSREHRRNHIIRVADCLSYLQFIFFSGSLSLTYPGFFQPIVSRTSWSTLMLRLGIVARRPWYPGTHDGLYAINGTFGGTPGIELMTQVMGGTLTFDTWLNTLALSAVVLLIVAALVYLRHRLTRGRSLTEAEHSLLSPHDGNAGLKDMIWATLRLFCSYMLLPLVAWSTYQFTYTGRIPIYGVVAAGSIICVLVIPVWWALREKSPQQMGYLLVDGANGHQNSAWLSQTQGLLATSIFVLLFMRGAIIGGLQIVGLVQLPMLMAIEIVQVSLYAYAYRQNPFKSRVGVLPTIRLSVLCLEVAFLPGTAGFRTKSVLGYAILGAHGAVLLFCFLLPALHDVFCLATAGIFTTGSQEQQTGRISAAYSLRQIMRRPTKDFPLGVNSTGTTRDIPHAYQSSTFRDSDSALFPSDASGYSYFRSPRRSPRPNAVETPDWLQPSNARGWHSSPSDSPTLDASMELDEETYQRVSGSDASCIAVAVDPNVDYSFREVDLYYVQPKTKTFGDEGSGSRQADVMKNRLRKLNASIWKLAPTNIDS